MGGPDGQGGLSDACHACNRGDNYEIVRIAVFGAKQVRQFLQGQPPAGETGDVGRELAWYPPRWAAAEHRWYSAGQEVGISCLKLRSWVRAQLLGQERPDRLITGQCLRLPVAVGQRYQPTHP